MKDKSELKCVYAYTYECVLSISFWFLIWLLLYVMRLQKYFISRKFIKFPMTTEWKRRRSKRIRNIIVIRITNNCVYESVTRAKNVMLEQLVVHCLQIKLFLNGKLFIFLYDDLMTMRSSKIESKFTARVSFKFPGIFAAEHFHCIFSWGRKQIKWFGLILKKQSSKYLVLLLIPCKYLVFYTRIFLAIFELCSISLSDRWFF